tara:strand:- start:3967 stop:4338 length:372 start_codon:yes stop_codon:yes gene_type:complete
MKNLFLSIVPIFFLSCASLKSTKNDPFIGKYKMTVFDVDQVGDVPAVLTITKDKDSYNSSVSYKILDKEEVLNVISTYPLDNSTLLIESLIDNNQVDFELNFENSGFTGTAGGYYDLEGEKIE